ncbi:hypothetical protein [Amycolatopsis regifaucium]|uniref:hypothetical protein n=1 Tax=Amycolatopsis regifaucium TaxID=546365 RepID=UPI001160853C|nr:hypothetical protein [Amycolatopsis regifaucium]
MARWLARRAKKATTVAGGTQTCTGGEWFPHEKKCWYAGLTAGGLGAIKGGPIGGLISGVGGCVGALNPSHDPRPNTSPPKETLDGKQEQDFTSQVSAHIGTIAVCCHLSWVQISI